MAAFLDVRIPARFDPARIGASDKQIRRRVRRAFGRTPPSDRTKLAILWEIARINEVDLRLAEAIEKGTVDEKTKELVQEALDKRLAELLALLPPDMIPSAQNLLAPEWLEGYDVHPHSFIRIENACAWARPATRREPHRRQSVRTSASRARSPGSSSDDDPEPELALSGRFDGLQVASARWFAHERRRWGARRVAA